MTSDLFNEGIKTLVSKRIEYQWYPFKDDKTGTGAPNVLAGCITTTKETKDNKHPCHAYIRQYKNAAILWSAFGWRRNKEIAEFYFDWLLKKSPWSKTGIIPEFLERNFMFNEGFVWGDLDTVPANLLHNFLIASRMCAEWPRYIDSWYKLVTEYKLEPNFAFAFLTCFSPVNPNPEEEHITSPFEGGIEACIASVNKYDWPLDMATANEEYLLNFITGKPVGISSKMFYPTAETTPVNSLWGQPAIKSANDLYSTTLKNLYANYMSDRKTPDERVALYLGVSRSGANRSIFTTQNLFKVAQLENERILNIIQGSKEKAA